MSTLVTGADRDSACSCSVPADSGGGTSFRSICQALGWRVRSRRAGWAVLIASRSWLGRQHARNRTVGGCLLDPRTRRGGLAIGVDADRPRSPAPMPSTRGRSFTGDDHQLPRQSRVVLEPPGQDRPPGAVSPGLSGESRTSAGTCAPPCAPHAASKRSAGGFKPI